MMKAPQNDWCSALANHGQAMSHWIDLNEEEVPEIAGVSK